MTTLTKPIHRKTRGAYSTLYARPRQIVISLLPGDLIQFREAGRRQRYQVPVDAMFTQVVRLSVAQQLAEKKKARKARRKGA